MYIYKASAYILKLQRQICLRIELKKLMYACGAENEFDRTFAGLKKTRYF